MEKQDPLAVRLPKSIFDGLHKVWAAATDEKTRYSITALKDIAKSMGETATHDWLAKHPERYGFVVWHGCFVDENYPGE
jgi:hypothetical protein